MNTDKCLIRRAKQLARKECCNYFGGDCIYTGRPCHVINPIYPSIHSGAIGCEYFLSSVLGLQPELYTAIRHRMEDELCGGTRWKECAFCKRPFLPGSNRQKYCASCRDLARRICVREKQRRYYRRKREKGLDCYCLEQQESLSILR